MQIRDDFFVKLHRCLETSSTCPLFLSSMLHMRGIFPILANTNGITLTRKITLETKIGNRVDFVGVFWIILENLRNLDFGQLSTFTHTYTHAHMHMLINFHSHFTSKTGKPLSFKVTPQICIVYPCVGFLHIISVSRRNWWPFFYTAWCAIEINYCCI